jgi:hypothetical protein
VFNPRLSKIIRSKINFRQTGKKSKKRQRKGKNSSKNKVGSNEN